MPFSKSVRWKIKSGHQYYGKIPHALALQINLWVDRALVWVPKLKYWKIFAWQQNGKAACTSTLQRKCRIH